MRHNAWALLLVLPLLAGCPCEGPDPMATEIRYELVSTTSEFAGTVKITAVAQNVGLAPFISGKGQQALYLYEDFTLVAKKEFLGLDVGATIEVSYEREWDLAEEFKPQAYSAYLSYDPDIYIDGNLDNDDCNQANNTLRRTTAGLDALLGG